MKPKYGLFRLVTATCQYPSLKSRDTDQKYLGRSSFTSLIVSILNFGHFINVFSIERSITHLPSGESFFGTEKTLLWNLITFALSTTLFFLIFFNNKSRSGEACWENSSNLGGCFSQDQESPFFMTLS